MDRKNKDYLYSRNRDLKKIITDITLNKLSNEIIHIKHSKFKERFFVNMVTICSSVIFLIVLLLAFLFLNNNSRIFYLVMLVADGILLTYILPHIFSSYEYFISEIRFISIRPDNFSFNFTDLEKIFIKNIHRDAYYVFQTNNKTYQVKKASIKHFGVRTFIKRLCE